MSTRLPTNATLSVSRQGVAVPSLSALPALVLPARPETIALREVPAGKAFEIYFPEVYAVQETDRLTDTATNVTYRIVGVAHYRTPHAAHTEVVAEARLGGA